VSWIAVRVETDARRDDALAALFDAGAQGVHEDGVALVTHFPPGTDMGAVEALVHAAAPGARLTIADTPEIDWSEAWKQQITAHRIGALTLTPPWLATDSDALTIVLEPGMAFGTGEHATTRGVVRLMQAVVRPGSHVVDLGAGSAVLSIAAAKLGAARVVAVEMDPDAIGNAVENVQRNDAGAQVHVIEGDARSILPLVAPADVILANIVSSTLIELLPIIASALAQNGRAVLSGILVVERGMMLQALAERGWQVEAEDEEDIWWTVAISRR
jgi:ribosomal protein L11 methyltransferase